MRAVDLIIKKRDGGTHTRDEIEFLIDGYVAGSIPDYQISAWLMAVCFSGMSGDETGALTRAMIASGRTIDLSALTGPLVDKHSTGGVGDKVSLLLAPIVAACGVQVPMMSGRALGHTGGTLDKLESIHGYTTAIDSDRFARTISECGYAMTGQSADIVPADRLLYALRDVTGTVESIPLITASIMSKKFAEGASALVFDVKTGSGAFMKSVDDSRRLAESLIETGRSLGRGVVAVITRMDEPLGRMVGNFLEVEESAFCLMGSAAPAGFVPPEDLMEVTYRLSAWMLVAAGITDSIDDALRRCRAVVDSGAAYERFLENVESQGGDRTRLTSELGTRRAPHREVVTASQAGFVGAIDAFTIGMAGVGLGVGRNRTDDDVLPNVGIEIHAKVGERVANGDALCTVYAESVEAVRSAVERVRSAFAIATEAPKPARMIVEELSALSEPPV